MQFATNFPELAMHLFLIPPLLRGLQHIPHQIKIPENQTTLQKCLILLDLEHEAHLLLLHKQMYTLYPTNQLCDADW